jgi:phosphoribosylformylglycinamidine cyclo-ligase
MRDENGLTCAAAGVDIDAGFAVVERIKPLARSTKRPCAQPEIGGLGDNIPRVLPEELGVEIDLSAITAPKVFAWRAGEGGIAEQEMLRTFNCGIGMVAIVDCGQETEVLQAFEEAGETPVMFGRVVPVDAGARVVYSGRLNL